MPKQLPINELIEEHTKSFPFYVRLSTIMIADSFLHKTSPAVSKNLHITNFHTMTLTVLYES